MTEHVFPDGRRVQSGFESVYTVEQTAALVEEIKAKTYDFTKASVLSLVEAMTQTKGMGDSPAGRVLEILLRGTERLMLDIATKHVPEITAAVLDGIREGRELAEFDARYTVLDTRAKRLRERADSTQADADAIKRRVESGQFAKLWTAIGENPSPETVAAVMAVLESTDKPRG